MPRPSSRARSPARALQGEEDEVEADESLDDAAFIEEQDEDNPDVTDIIGDGIEKEDET